MNWKIFFLFTTTQYAYTKQLETKYLPWNFSTAYESWNRDQIAASSYVGEPLFLTPFIEKHKLLEARKAARVDDTYLVPGIESYAGYLTVNKKHNGNLWFWYFPVADESKSLEETPFIIWLQGGPGVTSLYGLFMEIGPFVTIDWLTIEENKYSWGRNYSLLFIDNPVGTGFSFTDDDGYATNQTTIGENLYTALQQFLTIFPELRKAPLFIAGESYAGKHIPSLGIQIHWNKGKGEPINFQGMAIGNGFIDPITLQRLSYFAREVGLVDDKTADNLKAMETDIIDEISNGNMLEALQYDDRLLGEFNSVTSLPNPYNYLSDGQFESPFADFVSRRELRRSLHVGYTNFATYNPVGKYLEYDFMNSAKPWLEELLDHYRVLVYSGNLDTVVPYPASVNTYNSLNYSGAEEYKTANRFPWYHNKKLAGYFKTGRNLLEVMVRGAGHMVPMDKPAEALGLITAFVRNISLRNDTGELGK